jgi:ribosomal protein S18 acetylase RimI-like enzyme
MVKIKYADLSCYGYLKDKDHHISSEMLMRKINSEEILVLRETDLIVGWLRFGYFWDNLPFMNLLMIDSQYRKMGYGRLLVGFWEEEMKKKGHKLVLTSSMANENAQHFYRKLGYKDAGCLLLEEEGLEVVFKKEIV